MDTPSLVSLVGATASAVATVLLTGLTAWYVRLTHALVKEAQSAKLPNVFIDLEFDSYKVKFVIGNTGVSPALNVRLDIEDSIPWRKLGEHPTGLSSLAIVKSGLKYLAPGRTLKFSAGYADNSPEFFAAGSAVSIALSYETELDVTITRNFTIELQSYSGVLFESFIDPEREVARAIRDAESSRSSHESTNNIMRQTFRKPCPTCWEPVSPRAKKCPHCLEIIPTEPE
jgi:hypothetical protein